MLDMENLIFQIAKLNILSKLVGKTFEYASKIIPIKRIFEDKYIIAFNHPKPLYKIHILLIPKKEIKDITELYKYPQYSNAILKAINVIKDKLNTNDLHIVTNIGKYQEIKQLHFHLYKD